MFGFVESILLSYFEGNRKNPNIYIIIADVLP